MDRQAFDDLYAAAFGRLVTQVHAMCGDREEARDCVQEAFIRAWSHRSKIDAATAEAWVRTTAYRLSVSRWRRISLGRRPADRALQSEAPERGPDPSRVALISALQQLPEDQRRALVLHHLCDLSVREVAAEVGSPEGTVKARLSRGRAALAVLLEEEAHS